MKSLIVSASGIRGVIGDSLHPDVAVHVGMAFGQFIGKGPVILGGDTRVSYTMVKSAVVSGLLSVGTDIIDVGQVPTPTVQQLIRKHQAGGGIVITASHNPVMWNGIKLMNGSGAFLLPSEFQDFLKLYEQKELTRSDWSGLGQMSSDLTAIDYHIDRIFSVLDPTPIQNSHLRVLIDGNNGIGTIADPILMNRLNIHYDILHPEPTGRFAHDPEPLEKNLDLIKSTMAKGGYDIGFVQDADGDRLVILDETGRFIGEDYSLGFCLDYLLSLSTDAVKQVVVNLSTSQLIDQLCKKHGATLSHTKVGETHVTAQIKALQAVAGGEGNGGVIYPKVGWGRDSLVGMVAALLYVATSGKTVSEIVATYPKYVMLREKVNLTPDISLPTIFSRLKTHYADTATVIEEDGLKLIFPHSWVHVRGSNTEPIMRIFIEAPKREEAELLFEAVQTHGMTPH